MDNNRVSKDVKLSIAKELVASYLRSDNGKNVRPEQLGELFKTVFDSLDAAFPESEPRRVGLG